MNFILIDGPYRDHLLPFTFTRPVADLRLGILTLKEKWNRYLSTNCSVLTEDYLSTGTSVKPGNENIFINASLIPNREIAQKIALLEPDTSLLQEGELLACRFSGTMDKSNFNVDAIAGENKSIQFLGAQILRYPWDLFLHTGGAISADIDLLKNERKWGSAPKSNNLIAAENIFVEEGATLEFVTINAVEGPVFIAADATVMEGSMIRGPVAVGSKAVIKMGAKIYGGSSIGPGCKVGGEVNNSLFLECSNKAHDGFIGNSVIGAWCNLGADTNNSNLKNNYGKVSVWNYSKRDYIDTGRQFCGLFMGDHSKTGINTMFNTGTVVGVSANVFGSGFPPKYIPSFSWGGAEGFERFRLDKAIEVAKAMYERRKLEFGEKESSILKYLHENLL